MTSTILTGATIFDDSGALTRANVTIKDERIVDVSPSLHGKNAHSSSSADTPTVIDMTGKTLLPGFIDCHVHIVIDNADVMQWVSQPFSYHFYRAAENLRTTLHAGVTTVRDAMGADLGIKQAVDDGLIEGPRMQVSLNMISQTGGHNDPWNPSGICAGLSTPHPGMPDGVADGVDDVRRLARRMLRAGADVLKVSSTGGVLSPRDHPNHSQFSVDELTVLVDEARAVGKSVMAHAQGTSGVRNAILAGVRSIEHGIYLDNETIDLMLEHDVWLVPTLMAPHTVLEAADHGVFIEASQVEKARATIDDHAASFQRAVEAGVRIAMGTDSGLLGHGDNLRELQLMHASGMSALEALRAATSSAAELLGLHDDIGTIAPGHFADFIVLKTDADPLDIKNLPASIEQVWKGGRAVAPR